MKRSKKNLLLILTMIIMMFTASMAMTACGNDDAQGDDSPNVKTEQAADKEAADEPIDDDAAVADGKTDVKTDKKDTKKDSKTEATKATQATTQATQPTEAAKVCYVSVEGYCSNKEVTLQGGDTAYSVLKRSGATVSAENTSMGVYVNGINGRFASGSSGWKYSLNGWEPNYSAGKCAVKAGDKISWYWGSAN